MANLWMFSIFDLLNVVLVSLVDCINLDLLLHLVWKAAADADILLSCFRCQSDINGFTAESRFVNSSSMSVKLILIVHNCISNGRVLAYGLHLVELLDDYLGSRIEPSLFGILGIWLVRFVRAINRQVRVVLYLSMSLSIGCQTRFPLNR